MSSKPACKYGASCYRKNPDHLNRFSHPPKPGASAPEDKPAPKPAIPVPPAQPATAPAAPAPAAPAPAAPPAPVAAAAAADIPKGLVIVLLVGLPASGKSTFCNQVIGNAAQPWTRVCQDVVKNGKRGTKEDCLKMAVQALQKGDSVFIDRCNLEKHQRENFLQLAKNVNLDAHAVVLNFPVGTCISRAAKRTSHEGDLQGSTAPSVVQRFAKSFESPVLDEGFTRISVCKTEEDVQEIAAIYQALTPSTKLESGTFEKTPTGKNSLDAYLKPAAAQEPARVEANTSSSQCSNAVSRMEVDDEAEAEPKTLAFPSLSTADFRFDHEKASDIIVETAREFLASSQNAGLKLAMLDIEKDSAMLSLVRNKAAAAGLDSRRFTATPGDITKLKSCGGPMSCVIANAANWRLKGGGGGVNLAIYRAAGPDFEEATKRCAKVLKPGEAVAVPLPASSPLRTEGVTHVIHVLGPNMNPQRPNCLNGDYDEGCKQLRLAYSSLFSTFASVAKDGGQRTTTGSQSATEGDKKNAFDLLMQSSKRKNGKDDAEPAFKQRRSDNVTGSAEKGETSPRDWPQWAQELHKIAFHPENHKDVLLEVTDGAVVIPDRYAKAKKHLLVVSRLSGLESLASVRKEHLPVLRELHALGEKWARQYLEDDPSLVLRLGYHWVPSMRQLHMHVISQDFDAPGLKHKKHWNSFTSEFFRDSKSVMSELEQTGTLELCSNEAEIIDAELRCHRCRCVEPSINRLKAHIGSCKRPLPLSDDLLVKT